MRRQSDRGQAMRQDQPLRIFYAAGPGDVANTYRCWKQGRDDPSYLSCAYAQQFFEVCRELNAQAYVLACCVKPDLVRDEHFTVEHRPNPFEPTRGARFHFGRVWYGLQMLATALRFRATVAVVPMGTYWFMLSLFRLCGVQVIPSLHEVLWCKYGRLKRSHRVINRLGRRLFARHAFAILSICDDADRQVAQLTRGHHRPIVSFLPSFRPQKFEEGARSRPPRPPFRVVFIGRIERNKGVFDLLEVAQDLVARGRADIIFDVWGGGSQLGALRSAVVTAKMEATFRCHGYRDELGTAATYGSAHVVVVPTTTEFAEGFPRVVAEAVLSGCPVVTSAVCPAVTYVGDAVVEVPPNDIAAYADAIVRLCDDHELYEHKRRACMVLRAQFCDPVRSWGSALKTALQALETGHDPTPVSWRPGAPHDGAVTPCRDSTRSGVDPAGEARARH